MLRWSGRASGAINVFYHPLQDVDIYVEDKNDESFYKNLIRRIVGNSIRIERVFPLGGRSAVLDRCMTHDYSSRKAFFLVDGDFYYTKGVAPGCSHPALHCLNAYCIENLIFCEHAAIKVMMEELDFDADLARSRLDFSGWVDGVSNSLNKLFAAYATSHEYSPEIPTVSKGLSVICGAFGKYPSIDHEKVDQVVAQALLNAASSGASEIEIQSFYENIKSRLDGLEGRLDGVSGKDFLLPLLLYRLGEIGCRLNIPPCQTCCRLLKTEETRG